ncbi:MAG: AEC family transporter [Prosthecobacter sp.]
MLSTLLIVLPVFALILAGWAVRRLALLGPQAAAEMNRFVVWLALPALLFDITSRARLADIWQPAFMGAFGLGCFLVFAITLACRWRKQRPLADAALDALGTSYANTGYIGFPLALAAFGPASQAPTLIAAILTVCVLFAVAIIVIETGLQVEQGRGLSPWRLAVKVGASLLRNPLLIAPAVGALFPVAGWSVPVPVESFMKLLGTAAAPCALVGLGLFLAEKRESTRPEAAPAALLIAFKLVLHPLLTWLLATRLFHLPPFQTHIAVLLAALPTGTGPYMLAEFYQREASLTSKLIVGSTVLAVGTIAAYLAYGVG